MSKLTDEQYLEMAHRMASTYRHDADGPGRHHYGFQRHTLLDFARAVADAAVQAEREGQEAVAWSYDLAMNITDHGYNGWSERITRYKPNVPEGSIRNLRPLYTTSPAAPVVPEGYVLVPVEPTEAMLRATRNCWVTCGDAGDRVDQSEARSIYRAMLAAAKQEGRV